MCKYVEPDGTIVYTNVPPSGVRCKKGFFKWVNQAPQGRFVASVTPRTKKAIEPYEQDIETAALKYRIPAALVRAIMHAESAFDPNAFSHAGASGLMQLMPETAKQMKVRDVFDPKENIEGGVKYLRYLANQFNGDMKQMVAAYNAGPEAIRRYGGAVPPFLETQDYVVKVLELYHQYKTQVNSSSAVR